MFLFSKSATKRTSLSVRLPIWFLCLTQERKAAESSDLVNILHDMGHGEVSVSKVKFAKVRYEGICVKNREGMNGMQCGVDLHLAYNWHQLSEILSLKMSL